MNRHITVNLQYCVQDGQACSADQCHEYLIFCARLSVSEPVGAKIMGNCELCGQRKMLSALKDSRVEPRADVYLYVCEDCYRACKRRMLFELMHSKL